MDILGILFILWAILIIFEVAVISNRTVKINPIILSPHNI